MKTLIIALAAVFAQSAVGSSATSNDYIVGPQDVLEIVVHGWEEMSSPRLPVDSDGTINFTHLGRVRVAGKSARQIEEALKKALLDRAILTKVSMTVTVREFRSQNIHVMGAVRTPGIFPIKGGGTSMLAAAIAEAGGFAENAGSTVVVVRGEDAAPAATPDAVNDDRKIVIKRSDLEEARSESRIALRNGDQIYVPKAEVFYVNGYVKNPGEYVLRPNLTIAQAITLAGGRTERAKKSAQIHRMVEGKLMKLDVKDSERVRPGDTVHVPSRWF
jgi:polysaccharide export outer membrane protein